MKHPACLFIQINFDISRALFLTSVARRYTDEALYRVKKSGKDACALYSEPGEPETAETADPTEITE